MILETLTASATVLGSGLIGYLFNHATRIAKVEENQVNHEKMDEIRFTHMEKAISDCAKEVGKLAGALNGNGKPSTVRAPRKRQRS
jgi:hypothetical protein